MSQYKIEKKIELFYLRCPDCYKHLDKIEQFQEIDKFMVRTQVYFECPNCKRTFTGYKYKLNCEGDIEYFEIF